jgi:hypothetical protein
MKINYSVIYFGITKPASFKRLKNHPKTVNFLDVARSEVHEVRLHSDEIL